MTKTPSSRRSRGGAAIVSAVGAAFVVCRASLGGSQSWVAFPQRAQQQAATVAVPTRSEDLARRRALLGLALGSGSLLGGSSPALADFGFSDNGPVTMPMSDLRYEEVTCDPDKGEMLKGSRVTYGLQPRCVQVTARITNPMGRTLERPGVFGRIDDKVAQTSVLPNALDGATDVGQFTTIEKIPDGTSDVKFRFVAAIPKDKGKKATKLPELEFRSMKVIWYPGGSRFEPIGECEMNPTADGCDEILEEKYARLKKAGSSRR